MQAAIEFTTEDSVQLLDGAGVHDAGLQEAVPGDNQLGVTAL